MDYRDILWNILLQKRHRPIFGALLDLAQRNPVTIQRHKRDCVVVMSVTEFEKYRKARINAFMNLCDEMGEEAVRNGLTTEKLDAILHSSERK